MPAKRRREQSLSLERRLEKESRRFAIVERFDDGGNQLDLDELHLDHDERGNPSEKRGVPLLH